MFIEINDRIYNMDNVTEIERKANIKVVYLNFIDGTFMMEEMTDSDYIEFRNILDVKQI